MEVASATEVNNPECARLVGGGAISLWILVATATLGDLRMTNLFSIAASRSRR